MCFEVCLIILGIECKSFLPPQSSETHQLLVIALYASLSIGLKLRNAQTVG